MSQLPNAVVHMKNWPTPKCQNANGPGEHGLGGKNLQTVVGGQQDQENHNTNGKRQELNPDWVEQLMDLPPGWTDLDYLETE